MARRRQQPVTPGELAVVVSTFFAIIFLFLWSFGVILNMFNLSYGSGQKVGQIFRLEHRGLFKKTWEAKLFLDGENSSSSLGPEAFNFTIEDEKMRERVQLYFRDNTKAIIKYRIEGVCSPFRSESRCTFLVDIEPVRLKK